MIETTMIKPIKPETGTPSPRHGPMGTPPFVVVWLGLNPRHGSMG